jgi:hypothetical protein
MLVPWATYTAQSVPRGNSSLDLLKVRLLHNSNSPHMLDSFT